MPGAASSTEPFGGIFQGRRVLVTGHTGFKGAWLCQWLLDLGASVSGLALAPNTDPSLFQQLGLETRLDHHLQDIRQPLAVAAIIRDLRPDFLFHLAAQPLVRLSYQQPVQTWETNVMGVIHVLEALRTLKNPCAALFITTDKCYENREWLHAYREIDPLGGYDPYSSSKAAAEIVISAYRRSFFGKHPVRIASARAGNVIGGGDWARDRIVPDCIRALQRGGAVPVRNPSATRPWQHVLEPLSGYLWLGAVLAKPELAGATLPDVASAFNFGPEKESNRTVAGVVTELLKCWPGKWEDRSDPHAVHEATLLMLSTAKAKRLLHWSPAWPFETAVAIS